MNECDVVVFSEVTLGGEPTIVVEGSRLRLTVLPQLGAKVASLVDLATAREWLAGPTRLPYRRPEFGAAYERDDASGWDECFPSIAPGFHPSAPWAGTPLPDHGELWSRPWTVVAADDGLVASIYGARFPFCFERRLSLDRERVHAEYAVTNLSEFPFPCMWSMHPLFATRPGMSIVMPAAERVRCDYTAGTSIGGYLESLDWPQHGGDDLSRLPAEDSCVAMKLYTRPGVQRVALQDPVDGSWLGIAMDAERTQFGLWLNHGGWPSVGGLYHTAVEPCTGGSDDLGVACRLGEAISLAPESTVRWRVTIQVGSTDQELADFLDGQQWP